MGKKLIACSIDVSAINKAKIKPHQNGKKYYNFTVSLSDEEDQYGNHAMISESTTKEERDNDIKGTILGNGKVVWSTPERQQPKQETAPSNNPEAVTEIDDDVPF
jgi:hypothetical protein